MRLKGEKETCRRDEECQNSMACSNGQCLLYGSLSDHEPTDNSLACASGFSSYKDGQQVCAETPRIVSHEGPDYKCSSSQDTCKYASADTFFETPCACGLTPTGASFCPHIYTTTYTQLLRQVTQRLSTHCHTTDRLNIYECLVPAAQPEDMPLLNAFIVEHFERLSNNQVRENDACMQQHS